MAAALLLAAPLSAAPPDALTGVRAAAASGNADAQFALGEAFRLGRGVAADRGAAVEWYRRAAAQGHAEASDDLGFLLFAEGKRAEAMPYVEKAAARGDPRAFYLLGTAHFNGDYAARDWPLAYAQMSRAAEAGLPAAQKSLAVMGRYLPGADRTRADTILTTLPPIRPPAPPPPAPAPAARAVAQLAAPAPPPAARGAWRVQLGAYRSAERARADGRRLAARVPALAGYEQRVVPAAGAVQRLQAAGLADRGAADALCRQVRSTGGPCFAIAP